MNVKTMKYLMLKFIEMGLGELELIEGLLNILIKKKVITSKEAKMIVSEARLARKKQVRKLKQKFKRYIHLQK